MKKHYKYPFLSLLLATAVLSSACSGKKEANIADAVNPNTGDSFMEMLTTLENKSDINTTSIYFVQTDGLRVRSKPSVDGEVLGKLNINDQVRVVKVGDANSDFVQIDIIESDSDINSSNEYFISFKYLSTEARTSLSPISKQDNVFIVQNVASEILRVYEKDCSSGECRNRMVVEVPMVVGEPKGGTHTVVGNFRITKWFKFYQDGGAQYPSWYDPNYPRLPGPGKGIMTWKSDDLLPGGRGSIRGAFGWYTAHVGPNSHNQWTHGTIGWGADKNKFIDKTRGFFANLFADPRSHGCSRVDNESIAFIRQIVPVGAPVFKIYALESLEDSSLSGYSQNKEKWSYILTKNGVRVDGQKADRDEVLSSGTPQNQWLEEGTYEIDAYPNVKPYGKGSAKSGKKADIYDIGKGNFRGVFYVDTGVVKGYSHPAQVGKGGSDQPFPTYFAK